MTLAIHNLNRWTLPLRQTYVDPQLTVEHCHASYIRGWCDVLDGDTRISFMKNPYYDNPFCKYYFYSKFKSWGCWLR